MLSKNLLPIYGTNHITRSLLLHGDGTQGSTSIIDSSPSAKTIESMNGAFIETSIKKIGTGSISFNGTNQYLRVNNSGITLGASTFCVEMYVYLRANPTPWNSNYEGCLFSDIDATNRGILLSLAGTPSGWTKIGIYSGGGYYVDYTFNLNTWYHIALTRDASGIYRIFVNGSSVFSNTIGTYVSSQSVFHYIGRNREISSYQYMFNGLIDEFSFHRNQVVYTSNFNPTTIPLD